MKGHLFKEFRQIHSMCQLSLGVNLGIPSENAQGRISHYETHRREVPIALAYRFVDFAEKLGEAFELEDVYPRERFQDQAEVTVDPK